MATPTHTTILVFLRYTLGVCHWCRRFLSRKCELLFQCCRVCVAVSTLKHTKCGGGGGGCGHGIVMINYRVTIWLSNPIYTSKQTRWVLYRWNFVILELELESCVKCECMLAAFYATAVQSIPVLMHACCAVMWFRFSQVMFQTCALICGIVCQESATVE